ncbi:MAG: hypothetical protein HFF09_05680 [Oscillospiraceae bacterium]|nr:hypothetical protein [Oscillospiraceae bacterium]
MEVKRLKKPTATKTLYFLGKFCFNLFTGMEMYYFASYLTDVALLPVALAGLALNIPTIVDLILTFVNGVIMEKLKVPIGKYRFWLIVGPIVAAITYATCYIRFDDDFFCAVMATVMLIIAHFFWSLAESTYTSLPAIITDDTNERSSLSMLCGAGSNWSSFLFGLIGMPLIIVFNQVTGSTTHGYALLTLVVGALYAISYIMLAMNIKEVEKAEAEKAELNAGRGEQKVQGPSLKAMLMNVAKNPPLIVLLVYSLFYWINSFVMSGIMAYYYNCTLGAAALMGIAITTRSVGGMITPFVYPLIDKIFKGNKRNIVIFGNAVNIIRMIVTWALRPGTWAVIISTAICSFIAGVSIMPLIAMYADCATYGEWKTGAASKSFVMSLYCVPLKIGLVGNRAILTAVLGIIGYSALAEPSQYSGAFNFSYNMLMAILLIIACVILFVGYHLTEEKVKQCALEVDRRNAAAAVSEEQV